MLDMIWDVIWFVLSAKFLVGAAAGAFIPAVKLYLLKAEQAAVTAAKKGL